MGEPNIATTRHRMWDTCGKVPQVCQPDTKKIAPLCQVATNRKIKGVLPGGEPSHRALGGVLRLLRGLFGEGTRRKYSR